MYWTPAELHDDNQTFSNYNQKRHTPVNGILLSSSLSTIFILLGDFSNLTLFYGVSPHRHFHLLKRR